MNWPITISITTFLIATVLILFAGYWDLRYRKLPGKNGNLIPSALIIIGIINVVLGWKGQILLLIINALFALTILYLYKPMGMKAGDAKILIGMCIAFPFGFTTVYTFILALIPGAALLLMKVRPLPYLTCLAIGYLILLCWWLL